jgi:hypothetical protein
MPQTPFSELAAEMIAAGATLEDVGQCAVATLREAILGRLTQARDRTALEKAVEGMGPAVADTVHDVLLHWGTLSSEEKEAYLKGLNKVVVGPKVPTLLSELEAKFLAGEKTALFAAIRVCAEFSCALPDWAAAAFMEGYAAVERLNLDSWDDAFGRPKVKGQRLPNARKRHK